MYAAYDSLGGHSLGLGADDLERLERTHYAPAPGGGLRVRDANVSPGDSSSVALKASARNLEASIQETLQMLNSEVAPGGPDGRAYRAAIEVLNPVGGPLGVTPRGGGAPLGAENVPPGAYGSPYAGGEYGGLPMAQAYSSLPRGESQAYASPPQQYYGGAQFQPAPSYVHGHPESEHVYAAASYPQYSTVNQQPQYPAVNQQSQYPAVNQQPQYSSQVPQPQYANPVQQPQYANQVPQSHPPQGAHTASPLTPPQSARTPGDAVAKVQQMMGAGAPHEDAYVARIARLQADFDRMLRQHQGDMALRDELERGLRAQLEDAQAQLAAQRRRNAADAERWRTRVAELTRRLERMQRRLEDAGGVPSDVEAVRRACDERIAQLARSFEQEKAAAIENTRARMRAEIGVLVPRIKERFQAAVRERLAEARAQLSAEFEAALARRTREMDAARAADRRAVARRVREHVLRETEERLRAHYEAKLADVRAECERALSARRGASSRPLGLDSDYDSIGSIDL